MTPKWKTLLSPKHWVLWVLVQSRKLSCSRAWRLLAKKSLTVLVLTETLSCLISVSILYHFLGCRIILLSTSTAPSIWATPSLLVILINWAYKGEVVWLAWGINCYFPWRKGAKCSIRKEMQCIPVEERIYGTHKHIAIQGMKMFVRDSLAILTFPPPQFRYGSNTCPILIRPLPLEHAFGAQVMREK